MDENRRLEGLEEADFLFRRMVRRFVKERDRVSVDGVTLPGLMILNLIIREGEQRLGDLADRLDFTSGAITALCDKLDAAGFAARRRKEDDRRTVLLDITPAGRRMMERNRNVGEACISLLFGDFTEEELALLGRGFRRITDRLDGFSAAIMELARQNAEAPVPVPGQKRPRAARSRYLGY
ncbi:winged helix DNA-binding protein [Paenibacillus spiritus]|uniref:Winged helix DNA-binding protein n=1 Tax=Paenibacillus spiritus TaxID=2496557 RepID=A0A5J5FS84_9BACL|nr:MULTISPECIES: MarR family transcriptional regulator [Paenibacillus]KAA8996229.1 winged helix DNA-binding protein [Paenibacillus spiritus]